MKVTIVKKQYFENKKLVHSVEEVAYPQSIIDLSNVPIGFIAEKIKLDCEFERDDIPYLIKFLQNAQQCFVIKTT